MRISVVIPTHQRRDLVCRAVESVLAGRRPADEILVIDDGSTDGTAEALRRRFDGAIRLIGLHPNGGVARARNAGIAAASHRWIALLDSDDTWLPDHLERLEAAIAANPDCAITQTRERWFRKGKRVNPKAHHRPTAGDIFLRSLALCLVSSSAVLFDRRLLERVGAYDERLPVCEDYDLWLRIAKDTPVGLVDAETVVKDGGRADQLSRRYWGMDRFRVFALSKLVFAGLPERLDEPTRRTCLDKLAILQQGAARRERDEHVDAYRAWAEAISTGRRAALDACAPAEDPIRSVLLQPGA